MVTKFIVEHTHALATPRNARMLWSHRKVTPAHRNLIDTFESNNIRTTNQRGVFEVHVGSMVSVGFIEKDVRNVKRDKNKEKRGRDCQLLYEYFQNLKEMNLGFCFSIEKDSEDQIKLVFWANQSFLLSSVSSGMPLALTLHTTQINMISFLVQSWK